MSVTEVTYVLRLNEKLYSVNKNTKALVFLLNNLGIRDCDPFPVFTTTSWVDVSVTLNNTTFTITTQSPSPAPKIKKPKPIPKKDRSVSREKREMWKSRNTKSTDVKRILKRR